MHQSSISAGETWRPWPSIKSGLTVRSTSTRIRCKRCARGTGISWPGGFPKKARASTLAEDPRPVVFPAQGQLGLLQNAPGIRLCIVGLIPDADHAPRISLPGLDLDPPVLADDAFIVPNPHGMLPHGRTAQIQGLEKADQGWHENPYRTTG